MNVLHKLTMRPLLLATTWTLFILGALSVPGPDLPSDPALPFLDKVVHFGLFAVFGGLWLWALQWSPLRSTRWVLLAGGLYAILLEFYQGLLPILDRSSDPLDALAGILGLLVAIGVCRRWLPAVGHESSVDVPSRKL